MKVNGKDDIPYIMENKKMFQTTNQHLMMGGWPDDVLEMKRHEHDDKTVPRHSSVSRKFSN